MHVQGIVFAGDALGRAPAGGTGVEADLLDLPDGSGSDRERYVHVPAPDGQLHELVERPQDPPTPSPAPGPVGGSAR